MSTRFTVFQNRSDTEGTITLTTHTLLHLLHIHDSAFPIGGYTHTFGMETYIQNGDIRDRQSLLTYLRHYLLWAEILAPGRLRHQERFAYHFVKIVFDVWKREGTSAEEWISHDSFSWDRNTGDIQGIGVLDGCLYLGTMWFFSPVAKQMDERLWHEKLQRPDMKAGVTRTEADGLHFRWLAADGLVLKQQMERVWHQLKEMVSATHQF